MNMMCEGRKDFVYGKAVEKQQITTNWGNGGRHQGYKMGNDVIGGIRNRMLEEARGL